MNNNNRDFNTIMKEFTANIELYSLIEDESINETIKDIAREALVEHADLEDKLKIIDIFKRDNH